MLGLPHLLQVNKVRDYSPKHGFVFVVGDIIFNAGFFHETAYRWVVNVTDAREEMVFNLKIQASKKPVKPFT